MLNMINKKLFITMATALLINACNSPQNTAINGSGKEVTLLLRPRPGNPKNFSGDMIRLKDGRILYLYAYGVGDRVADDAPFCTVARYSSDNGKTWTQDDVIMHIEGGLSFLRLQDGRIALFYLRFGSSKKELYPYMILSDDETKTWSKPVKCVDEKGYYTINNDRIIQMRNGRIIVPVAYYGLDTSDKNSGLYVYYSDDSGKSWHKSGRVPNPKAVDLQEPGVIELKNGDLMMFIRTRLGVQYISYSKDKGENWSEVQPGNIRSPLSPASIKRIPSTGDLLLVWNDNYDPKHRDGGVRTPLTMAISKDEGKTWMKEKVIECDPYGWYCYTAIRFFGDFVLLAHSAGNTRNNTGLESTQITRLSLDWVYKDATAEPKIKSDTNGTVILACADKNAKIYYSLKREIPHILYEGPIKVKRPTPLWIQAAAEGKTKSNLITAYVGKDIVQPALKSTASTGKGLTCKYFEGKVDNVQGIAGLPLKLKCITDNFDTGRRMRDTNFAFVFEGYIQIPRDGRYTFYLASNDGSVLYLDDFELIDHDGPHAMYEKSAEITLSQGKHKIALKYFQLLGGQGLRVSWSGPGFGKQPIPASVLFHGGQEFKDAVSWLEHEARRIIRASRRTMKSGIAAFPPQVGIGYEAFWLRDYAYTLEGSIKAYSDKELIDACSLFVHNIRPDGAAVDCIKFDGTPIYKPGFGTMGKNQVSDGSQFTVSVAWHTYLRTKNKQFLKGIIDLLIKTMNAVPRNPHTHLVHIIPGKEQERCPYGFTDTINKQGDVLFSSLLFVQAGRQLSYLLNELGRQRESEYWKDESKIVTENIRKVFWDSKIGLFRAATARCKEPDIWGSAFAVYLDAADAHQQKIIARYFKNHYNEIVQKGQIRHLPGGVYWEQTKCKRDTYQNGAYWATPTGWFVYTLAMNDPKLAEQTVIDMVDDFKQFGACEWIFGQKHQLPNYLVSAALPLSGIRAMIKRQ